NAGKVGTGVGNVQGGTGPLDGVDHAVAVKAALVRRHQGARIAREIDRVPATGDPLQALAPGGHAALLAGIALVKRKLELTSLQGMTHGNAQPATHIEADPRPR